MNHQARLQSLQQTVESKKLDGLLISHPPNLRYLCGFTGSTGALLVNSGESVFFTDGR
jgi:Xaa-Pro aminopeptidase